MRSNALKLGYSAAQSYATEINQPSATELKIEGKYKIWSIKRNWARIERNIGLFTGSKNDSSI